jgi:hypothetical protein
VRDAWKSALEWYIYYTDRPRKAKYACAIMLLKDRLVDVASKSDLMKHYTSRDDYCASLVESHFPHDTWLDCQLAEDVAYGVRCLELSTGKQFDLMRQAPSRWLIETVA